MNRKRSSALHWSASVKAKTIEHEKAKSARGGRGKARQAADLITGYPKFVLKKWKVKYALVMPGFIMNSGLGLDY